MLPLELRAQLRRGGESMPVECGSWIQTIGKGFIGFGVNELGEPVRAEVKLRHLDLGGDSFGSFPEQRVTKIELPYIEELRLPTHQTVEFVIERVQAIVRPEPRT